MQHFKDNLFSNNHNRVHVTKAPRGTSSEMFSSDPRAGLCLGAARPVPCLSQRTPSHNCSGAAVGCTVFPMHTRTVYTPGVDGGTVCGVQCTLVEGVPTASMQTRTQLGQGEE